MTDQKDNESESTDETGSAAAAFKFVTTHFGPYTVILRLTATDQFVEVVTIRVAKDFRSTQQRNKGVGFHDVSDLYEGKDE